METIIAHPKNKDEARALKAVMKVLKIDFISEKSPYNPKFVKKISEGVEERKACKPGMVIDAENMWK